MRLGIWLAIAVSVCFGKNFNHKKVVRSLPVVSQSSSFEMEESSHNTTLQRNDTTTIWFDDLEGDVSGWTLEEGWRLQQRAQTVQVIVFTYPTHTTTLLLVLLHRQYLCHSLDLIQSF